MKKHTYFSIVFLFMLSIACTSGQNKTEETSAPEKVEEINFGDRQEDAVIGKWINSTIDVDLDSYNNTDTSFHVAINEDNWELKMNIKPVLTELHRNGTFLNQYRDTLGNVFHTNSGIWYIDGDSLYLEDKEGELYTFKVLVNGNIMEMTTIVDYDEDGKKDDHYFGKYRKIND